MYRLTWPIFIQEAYEAAKGATCTRLSVGAVIVVDGEQISTGYNTSVPGDELCIDVGCRVVNNHCVRTVHAEQEAILACANHGVAVKGGDLYVTHFPCLLCAKEIIRAGIARVFYAEDYRNNDYAKELFELSGIEVIQCEPK